MKGALIGGGYFAQFHADGWNRIPDVEIVAVADPDESRRSAFAAKWGIARQYATAEELFDREQLDFVDIATRPDSHLALTKLAAERKVHVICQKPMAPSMPECREMVQVCRDKGLRLIVHENWRWQPWYREIAMLLESGLCGKVYHAAVHMRTGDGRGREPYAVQPYFREMPRLLIYETLVHFLDTFRYLIGEIAAVRCTTQRVNSVIAGEDYAIIQIRFAKGAYGLIDANRISGDVPSKVAFGNVQVEGDMGTIRMTPDGDLFVTAYGTAEVMHDYTPPEIGYKGDSVRAFQQHAADCLRTGTIAESEGEDYLKTVALVEACYRSAESGREEPVE